MRHNQHMRKSAKTAAKLVNKTHSKHSGALANRHPFGMSLVSPHNVAKSLLLEKVCHSPMPKTYGSTTPQAIPISTLPIHTLPLLFLRCRITPDTIRGNLLILLILMSIRWIDASHLRHIQNIFDPSTRCTLIRNGPWYPPMNTKHILINHGTKRHPIKCLVRCLPNFVPQIVPESISALINEGAGAVVFLPAIDVASFMVST